MTTTIAPVTALEQGPPSSKTKIAAWASWDWGTQPFNTVITTFVFAVYLTSKPFGDTNATSQALATSTTIAGLLIALLAPVLGQMADRSGRLVTVLKYLTWLLALISGSLFFVEPQPSHLWLGLALLGVGSIVSEIAGVNYNATIEQVASPTNVGRVSGFGWGAGYLGGILVLLLIYFAFIGPEVGLFGVTGENGLDIRVSMLVCMVWTLLFTIPAFRVLKDQPAQVSGRESLLQAYVQLGRTVKRLWGTSRHTVFFLLASALFRDGLAGVFAFGAVIATGTFGFSSGSVIIFGAAASIVAGVSAMAAGLLDDRLGPKVVIMASLVGLAITGSLIFALHDRGQGVFWACGLVMCMFVGPAQSASRSFLARLIPEGKAGEIFGLYATTGRVVSFLSPAMFGLAITLGAALTGRENTQYWGILGIVVVLVAGLVVMVPVKEHTHHSL
ncbi:MFS transporter [Aestuariimicrobium soli]|uniref:MFS transporter n=1 Tax=Aestuariimicrobium soli TaxID=2035834 RepID=UPI003EBB446F